MNITPGFTASRLPILELESNAPCQTMPFFLETGSKVRLILDAANNAGLPNPWPVGESAAALAYHIKSCDTPTIGKKHMILDFGAGSADEITIFCNGPGVGLCRVWTLWRLPYQARGRCKRTQTTCTFSILI